MRDSLKDRTCDQLVERMRIEAVYRPANKYFLGSLKADVLWSNVS